MIRLSFFFFSPPTEILQPFIAKPESPVFVEENSTKELVWKIINCTSNWQVRVVMENYTLYPNLTPEQVPIKMITDYNVTVNESCVEDLIIVNISIFFNQNVLDNNFKYVACKIYRSDNTELKFESPVNFTSEVPPSSTINTETNTIAEVESSSIIATTITTTTTTGSGCKLTLHLITLSLGLIVSCLASIMWITDTD